MQHQLPRSGVSPDWAKRVWNILAPAPDLRRFRRKPPSLLRIALLALLAIVSLTSQLGYIWDQLPAFLK